MNQVEIAHVLFMDLVGYSRLPMSEQIRLLGLLQELLRRTTEFRRAEGGHDLLRLPTGDGIALVFFRDPAAPARCALELAAAVRAYPEIHLRMGIHMGPVQRVEDINAHINVSGGGINLAQRVMDCGDAGHILVSSAAADMLSQLGEWMDALRDLGSCEVKHGVLLHLFNLHREGAGNPEPPSRFRAASQATGSIGALASSAARATPGTPAIAAQRVVILYKRGVEPDEALLHAMETHLNASGFKVFVDRHLSIGVAWAKEIESQIRGADAVIPLISAASVQSEMLAYEIEVAHEAAQRQNGKPRLLPVRVNFSAHLPEGLERVLGPLEYAMWQSPDDNAKVASNLVASLRHPPRTGDTQILRRLEAVGGAVPLESKFYVVRPADDEFRAAVARMDSVVLLKGARQMGKTSLLARGLQQARQAGCKVVLTDFQKFNSDDLATIEKFFLALGDMLADQLKLDVLPADKWESRRSANTNFERFLRREVLGTLGAPIVWGMDEVDRLFTTPYGSEVFGLFRSWHNERSLDPSGPWSRMTLAIAYATEAHLFITDPNQSPFNVGTRLTLEDFAFDQVADLNSRYGSPLRDSSETARFHRLLAGQPFLVRRGLHEMVSRAMGLAAFEGQADRDDGVYGDHLRRLLMMLSRDADLCEVVRGVLQGRPCPTPESFYRLRSAGIMSGDSARTARPRCALYATYFERHLL
jgi:class 3 adenylate cyclase